MKYPILFSFVLAGMLFSCTENKSSTDTADTTQTQVPAMEAGCYAFVTAKDTIRLRIQPQAEAVTGELAYHFFEKDRNTGTLQGQMKGDTLFADYTFASEGVTSVREVVFLKKENGFVEGYGEVEEKDGKMVFKNKSALKFEDQMMLSSTPCP